MVCCGCTGFATRNLRHPSLHQTRYKNEGMIIRNKTTESAQAWIEVGYGLFAAAGPQGLKVEVMARRVGKSKSSFYHHFADLECFVELLLASHHDRALVIADRERQCTNVVPELLNVLLDVKQDLLFNRQLRIHRADKNCEACFAKSSRPVAEAILPVWADMLGLGDNSGLARMVLNLSIENFYLQITDETLTYDWLLTYVSGLKIMVREFQISSRP